MLSAKRFNFGPAVTAQQEAAFFAALRLPNGTFKTTSDHRMDRLNEFVLAQWKETGFRPAQILDLGVSSGISSVEWLNSLRNSGLDARLTATDIALWADIVPLYPWFEVLEIEGTVLQYMIFGWGLRSWMRRLDYVTGYALLNWLAQGIAAHRSRTKSGRPVATARMPLISRRALGDAAITWLEDDVFATNPPHFINRFDAIRAANILNRGYFGAAGIRRALENLRERLVGPGSFLIINRTLKDGTNDATLFRLAHNQRFDVHARFGRGSEIEDLVLAV
jgi:hypothetical protein